MPSAGSDQHVAGTYAGATGGSTDDIDTVADAVLTASRLLVAISARSIATVDESITLPQFRLLVVLDTRGPLKLVALAEHLGVNPSTASRMVQRLVAADLVTRWASPTSRREHALGLTAGGSAIVSQVTRRRRAEITRIVQRMPAVTRRGLVEALTAFARAGAEPPIASGVDALWG
jgi:DNA-binding MarR family transcriptional regulator